MRLIRRESAGLALQSIQPLGQKKVEYSVPVEYRAEVVQQLLTEWQEALGTPAEDAYLEVDRNQGLVVVPEKIGKEIDHDSTWAQMPAEWDDVFRTGNSAQDEGQLSSRAAVIWREWGTVHIYHLV